MTRFVKCSTLVIALIVVMFGLTACTNANTEQNTSVPEKEETNHSETKTIDTPNSQEEGTNIGMTDYPIEIKNYSKTDEGAEWTTKVQRFDKAPERVVANTQGAAELLIKLGLTDKLVGVAAIYGEVDPTVEEEFNKIPVISNEYASKELVVGADPDLVFGRGGLFADADWGVGTVDALNELDIKTFVQNTSIQGATLDSLYQDIEQLGQIFDTQMRASEFTEELKERARALQERSTDRGEKTFAYVFDGGQGVIEVYSGNTDTFQADVLGLLGLKNSFAEATGEISREQLIATNPDILLIAEYTGGTDVEQSIQNFYADDSLQSLKAIQNKDIYIIDFNQFWGYSYTIFNGAEKLAAELEK